MTTIPKTAERTHLKILNEIRDGLFTTDQTGVITFVNEPLAAMHGLEGPAEMIGRHFSEFVSPEFRTEVSSKFKKAVEEESYSDVVEFPTIRKDGSIIFIQLKHGPIIDNGRIVGTAGVIREVTERKRAEQALAASEKKYRTLVENMSDVVYIIDQTGKLLFVTPSATRLLGYQHSEMLGHNIQEFTHKEDLKTALNNIRRAVSEKQTISNEYRLLHKNGSFLWMQTFTRPLFEGDDVVGVQGSFWDITERKQAEEALKASERKFRDLITNMQEVLYTLDRNGRITFVSPSVESRTQYRDSEIIGHHLEEFIFREDLPRLYQAIEDLFSGMGKSENEYRMVTKSGEIRWMKTHSSLLYEGAEVTGVQGILCDITESKRYEEALRESEERYRLFMNNSPTIAWIKDEQGRHVYLSKTYEDRFGVRGEECLGKTDAELWPEATAEQFRKNDLAVLSADHAIEIIEETVNPDGSSCYWLSCKFPFRDAAGNRFVAGIGLEITAHKRSEEDVRVARDMQQLIMNNIPQGIFWKDRSFTYVGCNNVFAKAVGLESDGSIAGKTDYDLPWPIEQAEWFREYDRRIMENDAPEYHIIEQMRDADGKLSWVETNKIPLHDAQGNVIGILGTYEDITERMRVEEALRESEEKFRSLVETTSDWIWEVDSNGVYTYASPRVRDLLGYEPEEVVGRKPFEFMDPDESARIKAKFYGIAKERRAFFGLENVNIRSDGRQVVLETSGVPRLDGQGNLLGYRGIDRDITDRKRAEDLLQSSHNELEYRVAQRTSELERKNRELQEFAFVAAHDLSEPLRKIQIFGSFLSEKKAERLDDEARDRISRMTDAANRMQKLLDALLRYSRIETKGQEFRPTRLNDVAREVTTDLEVRIRKLRARVEVGPLPTVMGDPNQLRQLFQNLIANAIKYRRSKAAPHIKIHGEEDDRACRIFVEDNGIGFDEKYLDKIFQPFQRLHGKFEYPGLGIGLSICKKIVERHGGTISAMSTSGKGSTFIVTLPVYEQKAKP